MSALPAYTPPSNGSTERAITSCAEAVAHQVADRHVRPARPAQRSGGFRGDAGERLGRYETGDGVGTGGNAHERRRGQRVHPAVRVDQRPAPGRSDEPLADAELVEQSGHLGAAGDERLGTDVERCPGEVDGAQLAAGGAGVVHGDLAAPGQLDAQAMRGDEARDAAADHADPDHDECTSSTTAVSTPGSVSGNTPCPRLKM